MKSNMNFHSKNEACKIKIAIVLLSTLLIGPVLAQKVGIGTLSPVSILNLVGTAANPTIPGNTSSGIFRIGISNLEGLDMGKMGNSPFSGWIQSGYNGTVADPLSLQPLGGNVSIGTVGTNTPPASLTVIGPAANPSIPGALSTGVFRVAINEAEGMDMGKMTEAPFAGWIQVGIDGEVADPLSLQPSGGKVGIGTTSPAGSAILDVSSTSKGFLPPRMTFANRTSIASPVAGLIIWCTNCGVYGQMQIYNGVFWSNLSGSPSVGVPAIGVHDGGGVIAYIFQVGDPGYIAGQIHGLVATVNDVAASATWGCSGTNLPGAAGTALGTGQQNTTDIVNGCGSSAIAARLCDNLLEEGYADWYLPSKDELNKLYLNQASIGGFGAEWYWSSSESSTTQAWTQDFSVGTQALQTKTFSFRVRAVRTF
jgi:hypothetical protein